MRVKPFLRRGSVALKCCLAKGIDLPMAVATFSYLRSLLAAIHRDERAQDVFEYLLVIGGVSIVIVAAVATGWGEDLIDALILGICNAIDAVIDVGTCA